MTATSPFDLSGRNAVVTGASSGIGQAIAIVRVGATVVGLSLDDGADTESAITEGGGRSVHLVGDTGSPADVDRAAEAAVETFGRLDILVNNAARLLVKPFLDATEQDGHDLLASNASRYMTGHELLVDGGLTINGSVGHAQT